MRRVSRPPSGPSQLTVHRVVKAPLADSTTVVLIALPTAVRLPEIFCLYMIRVSSRGLWMGRGLLLRVMGLSLH